MGMSLEPFAGLATLLPQPLELLRWDPLDRRLILGGGYGEGRFGDGAVAMFKGVDSVWADFISCVEDLGE